MTLLSLPIFMSKIYLEKDVNNQLIIKDDNNKDLIFSDIWDCLKINYLNSLLTISKRDILKTVVSKEWLNWEIDKLYISIFWKVKISYIFFEEKENYNDIKIFFWNFKK